jgi:hypothetical protein
VATQHGTPRAKPLHKRVPAIIRALGERENREITGKP